MKKTTPIALLILLITSSVFAQQEKGIIGFNNWLDTWTEFKPNKLEYDKPTQILSGEIKEDTKLYKRDVYLLLGDVFVTDSTTLYIEEGTVIIGDFKTKGSLTITNGSKIVAEGTQTDPIIFTSSRSNKQAGDWGGIFILGDAPTSKYSNEASLKYNLRTKDFANTSFGGENIASDSGVLKYVRIEFAGKRTDRFGYFSGLTLAGVGDQTQIRNVMVSHCAGNSFTVYGGSLTMDQMVSYKSAQNDYQFNLGAQATINNSVAVRSPYVSGASVSKAMNILAYDESKEDIDFTKTQTNVLATNLTLINLSKNLSNDVSMGLVNEGIFVGDQASFAIDKSVISGFNPAVVFDQDLKMNQENWYGNSAFSNVYSKGPDSETFIDAHSTSRPDFRLKINKIIATNNTTIDD